MITTLNSPLWLTNTELIQDNAKPDEHGSVTLKLYCVLDIYEVRYDIIKNLRKRDTEERGWDELINQLRSSQSDEVEIRGLVGDKYYYLIFIEVTTGNLLGKLKAPVIVQKPINSWGDNGKF